MNRKLKELNISLSHESTPPELSVIQSNQNLFRHQI